MKLINLTDEEALNLMQFLRVNGWMPEIVDKLENPICNMEVKETKHEYHLTPAKAIGSKIETEAFRKEIVSLKSQLEFEKEKYKVIFNDWHLAYKSNLEAVSVIREIASLDAKSDKGLNLICRAKDFINNKLF